MAIVVWHMYGVHLKRFNKAMFTGKQTEEEMLHEHPLELADIKAGIAERPVDPKTLRKRRAIYYPVAGVLGIAMLLGVYGFIGGEKTAITTVLPISNPVPIYVPQTPTPIPTTVAAPVPSGTLTWDASIGAIIPVQMWDVPWCLAGHKRVIVCHLCGCHDGCQRWSCDCPG